LFAQEFAGLGKDPFGLIAEAEEMLPCTGLAAAFGKLTPLPASMK